MGTPTSMGLPNQSQPARSRATAQPTGISSSCWPRIRQSNRARSPATAQRTGSLCSSSRRIKRSRSARSPATARRTMGRSMILRAPSGILPVRNRIATPGRSRIEFAPPRALWRGQMPGQLGSLKVNYETAIADRHGRGEKILQRRSNTITNWGMDQLASLSVASLVNYLVLSSTNDARKRVMSGPTLTVTYTSPTNIAVASDVGFFVSTDAGRTLKLPNVPELKIVTYTNSQNVVCRTPSGDWLPGFAVPGAPTNYSAATIYFTDLSTLATYFTQFNTYDAGGNPLTTDNVHNQF